MPSGNAPMHNLDSNILFQEFSDFIHGAINVKLGVVTKGPGAVKTGRIGSYNKQRMIRGACGIYVLELHQHRAGGRSSSFNRGRTGCMLFRKLEQVSGPLSSDARFRVKEFVLLGRINWRLEDSDRLPVTAYDPPSTSRLLGTSYVLY
jgi:hypothetical protein